MGFRLNCSLEGLEYRGSRGGTSQRTGKPWKSLILEDADTERIEVSVPQDLLNDVDALHLRKGDMVSMDVTAAASDGENGYSYVRLNSVPLVLSGEGIDY